MLHRPSPDVLAGIQRRLTDDIPLARHLHFELVGLTEQGLVMQVPFAPNRNHRGTVFGGSLAVSATLCGWSLVQLVLLQAGLEARLVIHRCTATYHTPLDQDFEMVAAVPSTEAIERFLEMLRHRGKSRLLVRCGAHHHHTSPSDMPDAMSFEASFVALAPTFADSTAR
ncbi:MAG: YiiD C-terminal domain-containing protein [Bacteroidota bacterium]